MLAEDEREIHETSLNEFMSIVMMLAEQKSNIEQEMASVSSPVNANDPHIPHQQPALEHGHSTTDVKRTTVDARDPASIETQPAVLIKITDETQATPATNDPLPSSTSLASPTTSESPLSCDATLHATELTSLRIQGNNELVLENDPASKPIEKASSVDSLNRLDASSHLGNRPRSDTRGSASAWSKASLDELESSSLRLSVSFKMIRAAIMTEEALLTYFKTPIVIHFL